MFVKGIAGSSFDILNPDVTYTNATAGSSGTVDITVTKVPRYIITTIWQRGSAYAGVVVYYDVNETKAKRFGYFSNANHGWEDYDYITTMFPTVSSTKVTYNFASFSQASRVYMTIYY